MMKGFANLNSSRYIADTSELALSRPSKFSKVKLTLTRLNSSSAHPEPDYEGTPNDNCKDQVFLHAGVVP